MLDAILLHGAAASSLSHSQLDRVILTADNLWHTPHIDEASLAAAQHTAAQARRLRDGEAGRSRSSRTGSQQLGERFARWVHKNLGPGSTHAAPSAPAGGLHGEVAPAQYGTTEAGRGR